MARGLRDRKTAERWQARSRLLKAMAHPSRLFLLDELSRGERCVCELTELVGADTSTVSKHLALLRGAGLVADERRGAQVFYRLQVPCALTIFDCIERSLGEIARDQADLAQTPPPQPSQPGDEG